MQDLQVSLQGFPCKSICLVFVHKRLVSFGEGFNIAFKPESFVSCLSLIVPFILSWGCRRLYIVYTHNAAKGHFIDYSLGITSSCHGVAADCIFCTLTKQLGVL